MSRPCFWERVSFVYNKTTFQKVLQEILLYIWGPHCIQQPAFKTTDKNLTYFAEEIDERGPVIVFTVKGESFSHFKAVDFSYFVHSNFNSAPAVSENL